MFLSTLLFTLYHLYLPITRPLGDLSHKGRGGTLPADDHRLDRCNKLIPPLCILWYSLGKREEGESHGLQDTF